ncbi:hypothetical protein BMS3Bbin13_01430 [bacterium BMS3Bbin13]|nr:hypothetical protein BMS3Bbin13_01430 [bacterium BMS3Bbin13]
MAYSTLVSPRILAARLHDSVWRVFAGRFDLKAPGAGRRACAAGPISGACYAHFDTGLSGPRGAAAGRRLLPIFPARCTPVRPGGWISRSCAGSRGDIGRASRGYRGDNEGG